jgi:ribosomal protein L37E
MSGLAWAAVIGLIAGAVLWIAGWHGRRLDDHPICRWCGRDLYGVTLPVCPECGRSKRRTLPGNRKPDRWLTTLGVLVAVACSVPLGVRTGLQVSQFDANRIRPTQNLVSLAQQGSAPAFNELERRLLALPVDDEQVQAVFDRWTDLAADPDDFEVRRRVRLLRESPLFGRLDVEQRRRLFVLNSRSRVTGRLRLTHGTTSRIYVSTAVPSDGDPSRTPVYFVGTSTGPLRLERDPEQAGMIRVPTDQLGPGRFDLFVLPADDPATGNDTLPDGLSSIATFEILPPGEFAVEVVVDPEALAERATWLTVGTGRRVDRPQMDLGIFNGHWQATIHLGYGDQAPESRDRRPGQTRLGSSSTPPPTQSHRNIGSAYAVLVRDPAGTEHHIGYTTRLNDRSTVGWVASLVRGPLWLPPDVERVDVILRPDHDFAESSPWVERYLAGEVVIEDVEVVRSHEVGRLWGFPKWMPVGPRRVGLR